MDYMLAAQERIKYNRVSGIELGPVDLFKHAETFEQVFEGSILSLALGDLLTGGA